MHDPTRKAPKVTEDPYASRDAFSSAETILFDPGCEDEEKTSSREEIPVEEF